MHIPLREPATVTENLSKIIGLAVSQSRITFSAGSQQASAQLDPLRLREARAQSEPTEDIHLDVRGPWAE